MDGFKMPSKPRKESSSSVSNSNNITNIAATHPIVEIANNNTTNSNIPNELLNTNSIRSDIVDNNSKDQTTTSSDQSSIDKPKDDDGNERIRKDVQRSTENDQSEEQVLPIKRSHVAPYVYKIYY